MIVYRVKAGGFKSGYGYDFRDFHIAASSFPIALVLARTKIEDNLEIHSVEEVCRLLAFEPPLSKENPSGATNV